MLVLPDGTVLLRAGEPIPVKCRCGQIYQPQIGSEWSACPHCFRENVHQAMTSWRPVKPPG
jgi:hypothetical protein